MSDEDEFSWISATQLTLGRLITRPELSDSLLRRPPFRFIYDIIREVYEVTGFPHSLFNQPQAINGTEFNSKSDKYAFLENLIRAIEGELDEQLFDISLNKVLAGLEPERTNRLLVSLHDAAVHYQTVRSVTGPADESRLTLSEMQTSLPEAVSAMHARVDNFLHTLLPDLEGRLAVGQHILDQQRVEFDFLITKLGDRNEL
jgi:hypothetical protein